MNQQDQADTADQGVLEDRGADHFHQDDTLDHHDDLTPEADLAPDHRCCTF